MSLPWDRVVQLFFIGTDLRVVHVDMTLREAVDAFEAMPLEKQNAPGIALHDPMPISIGGRPALAGFLNAAAVRRLTSEPDRLEPRL